MSLTIKIFLFVLILVQTTAKYESMEGLSKDGMISGLLKPKDKREIKDKLVFGNSNEIYVSRMKKRDTPTELEETDAEGTMGPQTVIPKSDLNDAEQSCNETKPSTLTLYDVYNFLTAGKINEFFYNIKQMINNHEHLKETPRIFTTENGRSFRKLLSVENPEEGKNETKKKEDPGGDKAKPKEEITARSEFPDFMNLDLDLDLDLDVHDQTTIFHNSGGECHGDICKKPKERGIKRIITFPGNVIGGMQRKMRILKKALKNSKALRLVKILGTLKTVERSLIKFEYELPRMRPRSSHSDKKLKVQSNDLTRKKRFIFKNPKKEMEGMKVDKQLTLSKVEAITNTLKNYNLESQRLVTDLIVLMGHLRNAEHFEKQFPHIKTILHIPKTLIHDYPSLFFKVIKEMIGTVGDVKTSAKGGVRKAMNMYDRLTNHVKNHRFSKTRLMYKLLL